MRKFLCFCGFHKWRFFNRGPYRMKRCIHCNTMGYDWRECPYAAHDIPCWLNHCNRVSCKNCPVFKATTGKKK